MVSVVALCFTGRCDPSAAACCLPSTAILTAAEKKDPGLKVIELCHKYVFVSS